jgi:6-pyruvoyltetrahydropterin/6-carboxytetrahydropterin synthase
MDDPMLKGLVNREKKQETRNDHSMGTQNHADMIAEPSLSATPTLLPVLASLNREISFQGTLEIGVEVFFNARHCVVFQNSAGPIHNHSFRLKVCCAVDWLKESSEPIPSAKIKNIADQAAGAFNNQFLNDLPAFSSQQPTTEALAVILYQGFISNLGALPVRLVSLTLWESPTISVTLSPPSVRC